MKSSWTDLGQSDQPIITKVTVWAQSHCEVMRDRFDAMTHIIYSQLGAIKYSNNLRRLCWATQFKLNLEQQLQCNTVCIGYFLINEKWRNCCIILYGDIAWISYINTSQNSFKYKTIHTNTHKKCTIRWLDQFSYLLLKTLHAIWKRRSHHLFRSSNSAHKEMSESIGIIAPA